MGDDLTNKNLLFDADLYGQVEELPEVRKLVLFCIATEWYGVDAESVREVIPASSITSLPYVPNHILGIFSLRGSIVSVTDLSIVFGLSAVGLGDKSKIVVIEDSAVVTGLLVDDAVGVVDIPIDEIELPISTLEGERGNAIEGQVEWGGRLIAVLEMKRVIEVTRLGGVAAS